MVALGRDDFAGRSCRFDRRIEDRLAAQVVTVEGTARWEPQGDALLYVETGALTLPGQPPLTAERRYLWRFEGADVAVFFDDGRPFHGFRAEGRGAGTDHPCGADFYRVTYDFAGWPEWVATWAVTGPRKDYVSHTRYVQT